MLLHLVRASRGAAHTICAVNGDEGSGSHNMATSWDWYGRPWCNLVWYGMLLGFLVIFGTCLANFVFMSRWKTHWL